MALLFAVANFDKLLLLGQAVQQGMSCRGRGRGSRGGERQWMQEITALKDMTVIINIAL